MPNIITFLIRRFFSFILTFLLVTLVLYGLAMFTPVETRADLYMPKIGGSREIPPERLQKLKDNIIERYGLNKPFPVQYFNWLIRLPQGEWGYSPSAKMDVLPALLERAPNTAELILYSLLVFIPFGIISGVKAGSKAGSAADVRFRMAAFIGASIPPFILALFLLSIFWVGLYWFPTGRLSTQLSALVASADFTQYTGLLTIDGLLNGRPDVSLDALRHLVLPVFTLSLVHWATLGRITRAVTIAEMDRDYVLAARSHGISEKRIRWRHVLRNVLVPALNSSALSIASLVTGLFVIEKIFLYNGISSMFTSSIGYVPGIPGLVTITGVPDVVGALGFAVFSVVVVLCLMLILDILQAIIDPRIREAGGLA
ncbi:MAG: ABC transporter permease [Anaerolineaceae bacterium]